MHDERHPFGVEPERTNERSPCPYGRENAHDIRYVIADGLDGAQYRDALPFGWRRSGFIFYRNACEDCDDCVPIRIDVERIAPRKSQRKAIRRNEDLGVSAGAPAFSREDYELFARYLTSRHPEDADGFDEAAYMRAYIRSPIESIIVRYRLPNGKLIALSFLDVLPDGLSSVYFAFDPDESKRSLGVYSVFAESAICRELGMRWYYLGFWVNGCRKMSYKANFRPYQLAVNGEWKDQDTTEENQC